MRDTQRLHGQLSRLMGALSGEWERPEGVRSVVSVVCVVHLGYRGVVMRDSQRVQRQLSRLTGAFLVLQPHLWRTASMDTLFWPIRMPSAVVTPASLLSLGPSPTRPDQPQFAGALRQRQGDFHQLAHLGHAPFGQLWVRLIFSPLAGASLPARRGPSWRG